MDVRGQLNKYESSVSQPTVKPKAIYPTQPSHQCLNGPPHPVLRRSHQQLQPPLWKFIDLIVKGEQAVTKRTFPLWIAITHHALVGNHPTFLDNAKRDFSASNERFAHYWA
jgi:hypothetical protein